MKVKKHFYLKRFDVSLLQLCLSVLIMSFCSDSHLKFF